MISTDLITNMDENTKKRIRLIFNPKDQFPTKLYDVCNDGYLLRWNRNGSVSVPDEETFEANVMDLYPGFLQIPSFVNLRRLFREYGFDWVVTQDNIVEFSHPLFVRGRKQLLPEIKTRRKAYKSEHPAGASSSNEIIEAEPGRRYSTRKRRRTRQFTTAESLNRPDFQAGGEHTYIQIHQNGYGGVQTQTLPPGVQIIPPPQLQIQKPEVRQPVDTKMIQQSFVQNELTEEEFMQWLARKRMIEEMRVKEAVPQTVNRDYVWMYYDNNGGRPEFESAKNGELVLTHVPDENKSEKGKSQGVPCGMCKCCVAMSLLSADNSVVTDESFMVDIDSDVDVTEVIVEEHDPDQSPANKKSKFARENSVEKSVDAAGSEQGSTVKEFSPDEEYPVSSKPTLSERPAQEYQPLESADTAMKENTLAMPPQEENVQELTQTYVITQQLESAQPVSTKEEYVENGKSKPTQPMESAVMKNSHEYVRERTGNEQELHITLLPEPKYFEHKHCARAECV